MGCGTAAASVCTVGVYSMHKTEATCGQYYLQSITN